MFINPKPHISFIGHTTFRNEHKFWGQLVVDSKYSSAWIGSSGAGKTSALIFQVMQSIKSQYFKDDRFKRNCIYIDPHSDGVEQVYSLLTEIEKKSILYIDVTNSKNLYGFNIVKYIPKHSRSVMVSGILESLKRLFGDNAYGVRIDYALRHILESLMSVKGSTIEDIPRLLFDEQFKGTIIAKLDDETLIDYWKINKRISKDVALSIMNKIGTLLKIPAIRRVLIDYKKEVNFYDVMNSDKSILVNTGIGVAGSDGAFLLSGLIFNQVIQAGFRRVEIPPEKRRLFMVYADEVGSYITKSIAVALISMRKYLVSINIYFQYLGLFPKDIQQAILANVGFLAVFRCDTETARLVKHHFAEFTLSDFLNQENYNFIVKMLIKGAPSKAFTSTTIEYSPDVLKRSIMVSSDTRKIQPNFRKTK